MFCPRCKRKLSNVVRWEHDPPRAVLAQALCPRCSDEVGEKDATASYLDANGKVVPWDT
jgi:hypothetical protein